MTTDNCQNCQEEKIINIEDLTVAYNGSPALWQVNAHFIKGKMTAIVGPNGAGKSTLLKSLLGLIKPQVGSVSYNFNSGDKGAKKVKRSIAYVPQKAAVDWDFPTTVIDVVLMGRYSHLGLFKRPSKSDKKIALEQLSKVEMADFANRQISELSGGQRQRVFLARALAQEAELYILDEPLAGVDIKTEAIIMDLLKRLTREGASVIVVHHDLLTVEKYFDDVLMLNRKVKGFGPVSKVFTREAIENTYANVATDEEDTLINEEDTSIDEEKTSVKEGSQHA